MCWETLNVLTEQVGRTSLSRSSLSFNALLPCAPFYHTRSLPSFPSLGRSRFFKEALLSLLSSYPFLTSPIFTLGSCYRFFFVCSFYVHRFAFPPGTLEWSLGQRLRWMFPPAECRFPGARLRMPSEVLPPLAHRGHSVQGADQLSVMWLRWLLHLQISWTENSFWLKSCGWYPNKTNTFLVRVEKGCQWYSCQTVKELLSAFLSLLSLLGLLSVKTSLLMAEKLSSISSPDRSYGGFGSARLA